MTQKAESKARAEDESAKDREQGGGDEDESRCFTEATLAWSGAALTMIPGPVKRKTDRRH
jgi:hypothetical protein